MEITQQNLFAEIGRLHMIVELQAAQLAENKKMIDTLSQSLKQQAKECPTTPSPE